MSVPGLPNTVPFIGEWHEVVGLAQFIEHYLNTFNLHPPTEAIHTVGENLVSARYMESGTIGGIDSGTVRVNLHFHFRGIQIYRIDDDYDILGSEATVKNAKTRSKT